MGAVIRYESGLRVFAIVLAASDHKLRVATPSQSDSIELLKVGHSWMTERGEVIEIESLMQIPGVEAGPLLATQPPRAMVAGRSFGEF